MRAIVIAIAAIFTVQMAWAEEQDIKLKPASGFEKVEAQCQACHTLAYIPMNSPILNPAGWDAEVGKMIKVYGAPIDEADAKVISDYLKKNYGVEAAAK